MTSNEHDFESRRKTEQLMGEYGDAKVNQMLLDWLQDVEARKKRRLEPPPAIEKTTEETPFVQSWVSTIILVGLLVAVIIAILLLSDLRSFMVGAVIAIPVFGAIAVYAIYDKIRRGARP
jgi:hypothetical protein